MEEKITAVYIMVRQDELRPEDQGKYDNLLELQKEKCLSLIREKYPEEVETARVYTSRSVLIKDMERDSFKRLVIKDRDRLGATREDVEAFLFELNHRGVEVVCLS